ncbi:MAG: helix-turn-helix transcriptional regulator [Polyangia bacterium]
MTAPRSVPDPPEIKAEARAEAKARGEAALASRVRRLLQAVFADAASLEARLVELVRALGLAPDGDEGAPWEGHLTALRELLQRLREHPLGAALRERPACTPAACRDFAALVRLRREAAGLSRAKLARRTHISEASLKLLESGRHCPSRFTLLRLLQARELGLCWEDVARVRPELRSLSDLGPQDGNALAGVG